MKLNMPTKAMLGILLLLNAAAAGRAYAIADLLVDRGLPVYNPTTPNLNNAAGTDRANVTWGDIGTGWMTGDTFAMPSTSNDWVIDTIRIWSAAIPVPLNADPPQQLVDLYKSITLYADLYSTVGDPAAPVDPANWALLKSGKIIVDNTSENPDIKFTRVTYQGASGQNGDYQGQTGEWYQMWQVDFTNLNWIVPPGQMIQFGVNAVAAAGNELLPWMNHASNAALSNAPQDGADGLFTYINLLTGVPGDCDSGDPADASYCGWNKSSDINVQVFGAAPAPASIALVLIGLFGLSVARRYDGVSASLRSSGG